MERTTPVPGCRCTSCFDQKPHHPIDAADEAAIERCLTRAGHPKPQPVTINIFTMRRDTQITCDHTMTCPCETCVGQRQALTTARDRRKQQPWDVRPARRAA